MVAVVITESAKKDVRKLPAAVKARVAEAITELASYPQVAGIKALKGALAGKLRVRVGDYRIVFTVSKGMLTIDAIADRKEIYD
ncbi:MAG: type II toxin-antitoxin system RelE/ParE family toxin [Polyangiaceae bacterium]|nr:type II toxin-antitoxin system RelE/ParE family toxin [Polyangiaceae bacterium]